MQIISGRIPKALKTVIYGPEGIGKSSLAAQFPHPLFIDTEGSTSHMDLRRLPRPDSWAELVAEVEWAMAHTDQMRTLVIDTADWAQILCNEAICARAQKSGIEDFGYGKGYVYAAEEFGRLLNLLEQLTERGVHVVVTAHAQIGKFEQPDEMGAYNRWELKVSKQVSPMLKEWADMVLFASYKTIVVNVDGQGAQKGKNKASGGARVIRTTHHPCWDAKNRFGLPDEIPLAYAPYLQAIIDNSLPGAPQNEPPTAAQTAPAQPVHTPPAPTLQPERPTEAPPAPDLPGVPAALAKLMQEYGVQPEEIVFAVAQRGYFPADMTISDYPADFVSGVLVGAWKQVYAMILDNRQETPF